MNYDDFELAAFWVLSSAPSVLLVTTGIIAHNRLSKPWIPRYLILGILGCFTFATFAGGLFAHLLPPPYVRGLSEGRGLDLRGVGLFVGPWVGALAGVAVAQISSGIGIICPQAQPGSHALVSPLLEDVSNRFGVDDSPCIIPFLRREGCCRRLLGEMQHDIEIIPWDNRGTMFELIISLGTVIGASRIKPGEKSEPGC